MIKNKRFDFLTTLGMVCFFAFSSVPLGKLRGYEVGAIILLLTALAFLLAIPKRQIKLRRADKWLLCAGFLYVLVSFAEVWLDHQPIRGYDQGARFILTLPIFLLLLVYPPQAKHFFLAAAVGGFLLGSTSIYYKIVLGQPLGTMGMMPIQYACISMVIAAVSLSGIGYFYGSFHQRRRLAACLLCFLGSALGVVAVFLSGSRGSWGSILVLLVLMLWVYRHVLKLKIMVCVLAIFMVLGTGLYLLPQTKVKQRLEQAVMDVEEWQEDSGSSSSLGDRLVMWENAMEVGQKKWFLGWGAQGFMAEKERLQAQGEISKAVGRYEHPHNELLNAWVKRGVPGVLALLLIYLVPLLAFKQYLQPRYTMPIRSVALASISVPICFFIGGLSQTLLAHNSGVMFYVVAIALCWGMLRGVVLSEEEMTASGR